MDLNNSIPAALRIALLPLSKSVKLEIALAASPASTVVVADTYVDGAETWTPEVWGWQTQTRGRVLRNVDHHAEDKRFFGPVSSGNLAIHYVRENGPLPVGVPVLINHTDCDSILSAAMLSGILPPESIYGDAVVAADHTGAPNPLADLLQALEGLRDIDFSLRSLYRLLNNEGIGLRATELLAKRKSDRSRAKKLVRSGAFQMVGSVALATLASRERIPCEFFPELLPEAVVIISASPMENNRWETKVRLGLAAWEGETMYSLEIRRWEPNFGGRWNAGSTGRSGGSLVDPAALAEKVDAAIWAGRALSVRDRCVLSGAGCYRPFAPQSAESLKHQSQISPPSVEQIPQLGRRFPSSSSSPAVKLSDKAIYRGSCRAYKENMSPEKPPTLVKTRVAAKRGKPEGPDPIERVARHIVDRLTEPDDKELYRLPPQLILLLATKEWCDFEEAKQLPKRVRELLKEKVKFDVPLLGASMARLYCPSEKEPDIEHGVACAVLCSRDLRFTVGHLEPMDWSDREERKKRIRELARRMEIKAQRGLGLGSSADKDLVAFFPGYDRKRRSYDQTLFSEIMEGFGRRYKLFGASASDGLYAQGGYQFANDELLKSGLAISIIESDIRIGSVLTHGYPPLSDTPVEITDIGEVDEHQRSNWVKAIDNKPAKLRLQELHNPNGVSFTPIFASPLERDADLYFSTQRPEDIEDGQPAFFGRPVKKNDRLWCVEAPAEKLLEASKTAVTVASKRAGERPVALLLVFACASRFSHYEKSGYHWGEVLSSALKTRVGAPALLGLCAGEFGTDEWRRSRSGSLCVLVFAIGNVRTARGRGREEERKLREAAENVLKEKNPTDVMRVALEQAVAAGAEGGQIAIFDRAYRRILGKHRGHAHAPHTTQNWEEVKENTDEEINFLLDEHGKPDKAQARGLPGVLIPYSVESGSLTDADSLSGIDREFSLEEGGTLLGIVLRSRCTIIVSDEEDRSDAEGHSIFRNDRTKDAKRNLGPNEKAIYVAIPLPGAEDLPLGVMQVGFPPTVAAGWPRAPIDREILTYWHGFGQKVGQALTRAFEQEERIAINAISGALTEEVENSKGDPLWTPEKSIVKILEKVREEVKCSYAAVRLRERETDKCFGLYAEPGPLEQLQRAVRPYLESGQGSCDPTIDREGHFAGNLKEVKEFYAKHGTEETTENASPESQVLWREQLKLVNSDATVPLWIHGEHEGALILVSDKEYFFGRRKRRIARHAARTIEALLATHRGAWEKRYRDPQAKRFENGKKILYDSLMAIPPGERNPDWKLALRAMAEATACEFVSCCFGATKDNLELHSSIDLSDRFGDERVRDYGAVNRLCTQFSRFEADPALAEFYTVDSVKEGQEWLRGLNSALVISLRKADGTVRGLVLFGDRIVFSDRTPESSPYSLDDPAERRNAADLASLLGRALDARDAKSAQEQWEARYEQAVRVGAAGLFSSLIIHQLNSALSSIQGNVANIAIRDTPDEDRQEYCCAIRGQVAELDKIVREFKNRRLGGEPRTEHLKAIVRVARSLARTPAPQKRVKMVSKIDQSADEVVIVGELMQIVLGVVNVLDNAVDAVNDQGTIEILAGVEDTWGVIRIRNTGPSPSQETRQKMFLPGYSTKSTGRSMGIGLTLALQAFDAADGSLTFDHKDGVSEFVMKLMLSGKTVGARS
jgi:signal transduction histidine kinase